MAEQMDASAGEGQESGTGFLHVTESQMTTDELHSLWNSFHSPFGQGRTGYSGQLALPSPARCQVGAALCPGIGVPKPLAAKEAVWKLPSPDLHCYTCDSHKSWILTFLHVFLLLFGKFG